MARFAVMVFGLVVAASVAGVASTRAGFDARIERLAAISFQNDDSQPTVEALQTRVAELEATVAASLPTPTSTPAPRPTPAVNPVPLTADTELLYYYAVVTSQGEAAFFGEVRNTSDAEIPSPYVRLTLLDAEGNIIETVTARPLFSYVGPGETVPVEASYTGVPMGDWATEEVIGCGDVATDPIPAGLSVEDVRETRKDAEGLEIEGEIRNGGSAPVEGVAVRAVLFRPDGLFGGFGTGLIQSPIPPGKTARFDLTAFGSDIAGIVDAGGDYTYTVIPGINSIAVYNC